MVLFSARFCYTWHDFFNFLAQGHALLLMKTQISSISASVCARTLAVVFIASVLLSGCVSRSGYEADISRLTLKLQQERADHAFTVKTLEEKVKDRGRSLTELTERYITLQRERAQFQLPGLRRDMEILLKNLDELSLVVSSNLKGSEGREMQMMINDMRGRITSVLDRESRAVVPGHDSSKTSK